MRIKKLDIRSKKLELASFIIKCLSYDDLTTEQALNNLVEKVKFETVQYYQLLNVFLKDNEQHAEEYDMIDFEQVEDYAELTEALTEIKDIDLYNTFTHVLRFDNEVEGVEGLTIICDYLDIYEVSKTIKQLISISKNISH